MVHFAGAASRRHDQPLPDTVRLSLRRAIAQCALGKVEAHDDSHVLVLMESHRSTLPARFLQTVSTRAGWTLMVSGVVSETAAGLTPVDADAVTRQLTPFSASTFAALVGDVSIAAHETATGRLTLASSMMGVQPLYWTESDTAIVWTSSLAIARTLAPTVDLDRTFLSTFLLLERCVEHTPYRAVRAVRPGTVLTFAYPAATRLEDTVAIADQDLRLHDEREYAEQLATLVTTAIADRMPARGVCFSELSGGFDSSTVATVASRVGAASGVTVRAVHYTSHSSTEWDETRFAQAVAHQAHIDTTIIDLDGLAYLELVNDVSPHVATAAERAAGRLLRSSGGEILLSGRIGDAVFGNTTDNSLATADDLRTGHYRRFFHGVLEWSIASNRPVVAVLGAMLLAHVAPSWHEGLLDRRRARRHTQEYGSSEADRHSVRLPVIAEAQAHRAIAAGLTTSAVRPAKRHLLNAILAYSVFRALQNKLDDVLLLYPFADQRVLRFLLAIPATLHARPTETRYLMRRAFADLWPPAVRDRVSKGYAAPAAARLVRPYAAVLRAQRDYLLADLGFLDADALRSRLDTFLGTSARRVGNLNRIWYAEEWLRRRSGAPSLHLGFEGGRLPALTETLPQRALHAERR